MIKDINFYKEKLEKELVLLEKELSKLGVVTSNNQSDWTVKMPEENISPADENEVADTIDDFEINNAIINDLEINYNNIKIALEKIEKGNYGLCEIDKKQIEEERLRVNPSARTCEKHLNEDLK